MRNGKHKMGEGEGNVGRRRIDLRFRRDDAGMDPGLLRDDGFWRMGSVMGTSTER